MAQATAPSPVGEARRVVRRAVVVCLGVVAGAVLCGSLVEKPWQGSHGQVILAGQPEHTGSVAKRLATLRFYVDRQAPGREKFQTRDWVRTGLLVGSWFAAGVGLTAALTARWWARWSLGPPAPAEVPSGWQAPLWSRLVLCVAVAGAGAIRLPPLAGNILWDEQDNLRRNFHGYYQFQSPAAQPKWVEATLMDALWENERGNNPHLLSVLSHTGLAVWRALTGEPRERYDRVVLRWPSAVFGLLSLVSLWWMLNAAGLPRLAPWAVVLAAAHPLWAEFTFQARGYGLSLFLTPIVLGMGWRMVKFGRWRDGVWFGVAEFASLMAFPGSLYCIATLNLALAVMIGWAWRKGDSGARARFWRWVVVNTAAATAFGWLMAPAFPQMATYMNNGFQHGVMPPFWYVVSYNLFATGMHFEFPRDPFFNTDRSAPSVLLWLSGDFWRAWPVALWSMVVFPAAVVAGFVRWARQADRSFTLLVLMTLAAGALCIAHHALFTGCYIYSWYAIYTLPVLVAAAAHGITWPLDRRGWAGAVVAAAAVGVLAISHPWARHGGWQTQHCRIHPRPVVAAAWGAPEGCIRRVEFQRGRALWVNYEDGFQFALRDYASQPQAWAGLLDRPLSAYGRKPSRD